MSRHANISVFVPHLGCPGQCSFCNQHYIACTEKEPCEEDVIKAINIAKSSKNYNAKNTELAFFGGSFTAINRDYMISLLKTAKKFVDNGDICGIRISTRPDAINEEILTILKEYSVTAIELGAQSMDDEVLKLNRRGHSSQDVVNASNLIKKFGFSLGLQMMTGLLGDTDLKAEDTANKIIGLAPDTVRIYPTIVFENTYLGELFKIGEYAPQSLDSAVNLCARLLTMFWAKNISVIRTGLHTIDTSKYLAGPWHPAFRELCDSQIYLSKALEKLKVAGEYNIFVGARELSKMLGQKRKNVLYLEEKGFKCNVKEDISLKPFQIKIEKAGVCE